MEIYAKLFFGYENKEKHPIYVSKKCCEKKNVDILIIEQKGKRHYVLIKNYNSLIQSHIKNILLAVMAINKYVLMISLVTLLKHT